MQKVYLFDVDGTLTASRARMSAEMVRVFTAFSERFPTYLVSGSDFGKIREQVPDSVLEATRGVFGCAGATFHVGDTQIYAREHEFNSALVCLCEDFVARSQFPLRTGNHLEFRPGLLNVSAVGRNATPDQRHAYARWDMLANERRLFVEKVRRFRMGYELSSGGQISVDIAPIGWNKSVVAEQIARRHPDAAMAFFGDRMGEGGNDRPLAQALIEGGKNNEVHSVHSPEHTLAKLLGIMVCHMQIAA